MNFKKSGDSLKIKEIIENLQRRNFFNFCEESSLKSKNFAQTLFHKLILPKIWQRLNFTKMTKILANREN